MDINTQMEQYCQTLDEIDEIEAAHKANIKELKQRRDDLKADLLAQMNEMGVPQIANESITLSVAEKQHANVDDWASLSEWLIDNRDLDFLYHRVKVTEVQAYLEETGELPPGINLHKELNLKHRRK